ncbi:MAG: TetR/AcrR family transcriptional regulator [Myxococcales bacterium]|nr:TetR/AcrR family transcriptional regulator [Myxococcales bacterium]MDH3486051.1 TetR/AcrR family transcriptional regulator [Myxococcales bacterium]
MGIRRQQLLELGLELFATHTYDGLSVDEIARRAGISKGLLYHYFPSKRAFYIAAVTAAADQLLEETDIDKHGTGAEPDPEGVREVLRAVLNYVSRRRAEYVFLLRGGVGSDPEVAEILEGARQALIQRMFTRLARFGVVDDPPTRLRLRGWIGFLEGATLDWVQTQELDPDDFLELLVQMAGHVLASVIHTRAR